VERQKKEKRNASATRSIGLACKMPPFVSFFFSVSEIFLHACVGFVQQVTGIWTVIGNHATKITLVKDSSQWNWFHRERVAATLREDLDQFVEKNRKYIF